MFFFFFYRSLLFSRLLLLTLFAVEFSSSLAWDGVRQDWCSIRLCQCLGRSSPSPRVSFSFSSFSVSSRHCLYVFCSVCTRAISVTVILVPSLYVQSVFSYLFFPYLVFPVSSLSRLAVLTLCFLCLILCVFSMRLICSSMSIVSSGRFSLVFVVRAPSFSSPPVFFWGLRSLSPSSQSVSRALCRSTLSPPFSEIS